MKGTTAATQLYGGITLIERLAERKGERAMLDKFEAVVKSASSAARAALNVERFIEQERARIAEEERKDAE